ncbi:MAG: hypothetical protein M3N38_01865, partial [Pseudomonadota bacterium]|nr:hypothetical protein [Pseudomonadota bacterium]
MINPLFLFSGAALAAMAALLGVTADKWNAQPGSPGGIEVSSGPADPATPPASNKADAASDAETAKDQGSESAAAIQTAAVATEPSVPAKPPSSTASDLIADDSKPSFDTIRVEPDGMAVLAGRGMPDSDVTILFNDKPIGSAKTDPAGAWVLVPAQPLPIGDHQVTLQMQQPNTDPVYSEQSIALKVPERGADKALVVLSENNQPSKVLQQPQQAPAAAPAEPSAPAGANAAAEAPAVTAAAEPAAGAAAESTIAAASVADPAPAATPTEAAAEVASSKAKPPAKLPLNLAAVDYNDRGDIIFSGTATGGAIVRLYVDNSHVGDAKAEAGGHWQFAGKENIGPGTHDLRVDKLRADGSVAERVELPFVRAEPTAVAALLHQPSATGSVDAAPAAAGNAQQAASSAAENVEEPPAAAPAAEEQVATAPAPVPAAGAAADVTVAEPPSAALAAEELVAVDPAQAPATADVTITVAEPPAPAAAAEEQVAAAAPPQAPAAA